MGEETVIKKATLGRPRFSNDDDAQIQYLFGKIPIGCLFVYQETRSCGNARMVRANLSE